MGKKGKKKGKNVEEGSEGEPSQPLPAPQPVQQQQQRQPQQQQQQQRQLQQQQQQQRQPQQQQQQQQPQQPQQQQQQQRQPQQPQQQQHGAAVTEVAQGIGQMHVGEGRGRGGLGRGGRGRGDQGRDGQGRGGPGRGGPGRGGRGSGPPGGEMPQGERRIPGMPQAPGAPAQRGPAWGAQAQPPQGDAGRGGQGRAPSAEGPAQQPSSRASSTASARAGGDTSSVKSGGSGKAGGHKPVEKVSPVKVSLPAQLQMTYLNQIPKRKVANRGGTAGKPITVETNMIPIIFGKNFKTVVAHYDVKLDPDKPRFMYRPVVEAVRMKHYPKRYPVFDGRCNVFSAGDLPFGDHLTTEIEVENVERQRTMSFKVTLVKTQDIDMSWLPHVKPGFSENERSQIAIQALDVVLRSASIRQRAIPVGRSFFTPPAGRAVDLGNGMDLWIGTFQSAILGWKPYFNVDVAHKAFPRSQQVINLFNELCGDPRNPDRPITARDLDYGRAKLASYLKGLKVTYEIPGHPSSRRTMGINDLGRNSREATFDLPDGSVTTVENYFLREKRYKIRYPEYPTLWVGPRNRTVLIPAELCVIEAGQVTNKKMDERQTSTMIKFAATDAQTRKRKIMEGFAKMRANEDPAMKEFGVSVGGGFETVQARVLNPPALWGTRNILVKKGVWRADKFNSAVTLPDLSWTILNLNDRTQEEPLRKLVHYLKEGGRAVGMNIGEPLTPFTNMRPPMRDVREIIRFFDDKKKQGLKLVIVVVPEKGPVYSKVKQVAELNVGMLTQCIKAFTVEKKMNDATAGNILLKINSKLNGTNQIFAAGKIPPCLQTPCMIVGADVTHPSPDSVGIPSIAAVAASHGPRAFKYNVKIRLQPPRTEIILHLEQIIKEQLMFFYKNTGQKPQRIIFYRDGVSEGQFPQVMHHELQAIRTACRKLGGSSVYEPKITFLVVQKRHHIRLFPTDPRNSDDRNGNVQAGTVVDTEITHPSHIDFYLVSHASIQGTARPTKYRCLWDDSDMSEDEIEQLTYYLCHMFSRCTRSVSYPAPTYYAHLAAFRARALTNEVEIRLNNLEEEQRTKMTIKDEILLGNPMFFV